MTKVHCIQLGQAWEAAIPYMQHLDDIRSHQHDPGRRGAVTQRRAPGHQPNEFQRSALYRKIFEQTAVASYKIGTNYGYLIQHALVQQLSSEL